MALRCYKYSLKGCTRRRDAMQWAALQARIGEALFLENQYNDSAIFHYFQALLVYTPQTNPFEWANTIEMLARSYKFRAYGLTGNPSDFHMCIKLFTQALTIHTKVSYPESWAEVNYQLGDAYCKSNVGIRQENLEKSMVFFKQALQVYTKEKYPHKWARTVFALGNVFYVRSKGSEAENVEKSIALM